MEENYPEYEDQYEYKEEVINVEGQLSPEAKEYYDYKNQIKIMEKEKKKLESTLMGAKQSHYSDQSQKRTKQKSRFKKYDYTDYKEYEIQILKNMMDEQLFSGIGIKEDILGEFVDKVLERSLYVYKNRNCYTCAKLLNTGKSTQKCPKYHHLLRDYDKLRKK